MGSLPSVDELQRRFEVACNLEQTVDRKKIEEAMREWAAEIGMVPSIKIVFVSSIAEMAWDASAASDASDASAASDAWAASAASDAWAASAARAASAASDAWAASAASAASAARAAWAASAASAAWAAWDASYISIVAIGAVSLDDAKQAKIWLPILEAFEAGAFAFFVTDDSIFVSTIPTRVSVDARRRLHNTDGPAFIWLDDISNYYIHGVFVPADVVDRPETITVKSIDAEANAEVRRVMIDRYKIGAEIAGAAAYVKDSNSKILDHDERWGTLYRRDVADDEPILMLEVVNRTAERDGSFKRYMLRVDPECRPLHQDGSKGAPQPLTAHAAVASTFGKRAEQYHPDFES